MRRQIQHQRLLIITKLTAIHIINKAIAWEK